MHVFCFMHIKDNVMKKINECCIDKTTQNQIIHKLFGIAVDGVEIKGFVLFLPASIYDTSEPFLKINL